MQSTQFTRRGFARMSAVLSATATLPFYNEAAMAQLSMIGPLPPDALRRIFERIMDEMRSLQRMRREQRGAS